jgi:hypothetical protein
VNGPDVTVSVPKKVGVAFVESLISMGLSYKALPFPPVAGFELAFVGVALAGTLLGAVLALRSSFDAGCTVGAIVVAGVTSLAYSYVIAAGGVSYWWAYFAMAVYFGIFSGASYAISALAQALLKHS